MNQKKLTLQIVHLILFMFLVAGCNINQPAPTPTPEHTTPIPPTATVVPAATMSLAENASLNPSPRAYTSLAYDAESDRVILFGGQTGNYNNPDNFNGETWTYDVAANKWTQMDPILGPSGRAAHEMAYDAESDRIILFGGFFNWNSLNDTWAYDYNTNTWKEMTAKGPASHLGARLAYDAESDRIILFGGYDLAGSFLYNDTWAYDFNSDTWTEMKPSISPSGRNYQAMTYDSKADRVLTWGGSDVRGNFDDMSIWSYDFNTNTWQEMKPGEGSLPSGRDYPVMVYDAESDRTILYGGSLGGKETWAYDNNTNTWTKLEPSTVPGTRSRHIMVYSVAADQVILFGGQIGSKEFNYSFETWAYDFNSNMWRNVTSLP